jgi:hypothetical protein
MGGAYSVHGEMRIAYKMLVVKPEGKKPLGRPGVGGRILLKWIVEK